MNIFLRHRNKLMKRNYYLKENDELILIKVQLGAIYNYDKLVKIIYFNKNVYFNKNWDTSIDMFKEFICN